MIDIFSGGRQASRNAQSAELNAQQAKRDVEHLEDDLKRLQERFDKLTAITTAMWTLLKAKTDVTDEELKAEATRAEAMQQQAAQQPAACPQCGRAMLARTRRCLYCDFQAPEDDLVIK